MPGSNYLVLSLNLALALIFNARGLGAEEMDLTPQAAARRRARIPLADANQSNQLARVASALKPVATNQGPTLPPAPPGVTALNFKELFKPIGPRGLEYSEKLRGLDGRKVRILGYMVKQSQPVPWTFLLSPVPMTLHEGMRMNMVLRRIYRRRFFTSSRSTIPRPSFPSRPGCCCSPAH